MPRGDKIVALMVAGLLLLGSGVAYSQEDLTGSPLPSMPHYLPADSVLHQARTLLPATERAKPSREQIANFASQGIKLREDGKVLVEIIGPEWADALKGLDLATLAMRGAEIGVRADNIEPSEGPHGEQVHAPLTAYENRVEAWLPLEGLEEIAGLLPQGYFIKHVMPVNLDQVAGQGPVVINSDSYRNAGQNGAGLTIAVIDGGFLNLTAAQNNGDAPAVYTAINYASGGFESGISAHGTGCVEAAFDHAPGATWRIYRVDSVTDVGTAVNNAIANGVDIISHSMTWYNLGWADNTGTACSAANNASNNGIPFFTSSGNRADSHYQASFADSDSDGWHEFSPGDETINLTIGPGSGPGGPYYLSWSNPDTDLDFYLYNSNLTAVVASSTNSGAGVFEEFYFEHPNPAATFHLAVFHRGGPTSTTIEIFSHNAGIWNEHVVASNSTASPSNSTGARVLSVGAVTHTLYGQPNGSNVIASYSSRGPSNSGMTLPDLCGPTDTVGFTYPAPDGFGGTSCATPNAAGAACAFWSSDTQLNGYAIQWLAKEQADLWRDWGSSGYDNIYGKGGLFLVDYHPGTRWVARSYPGTANDPTVPYYTVQGAHNAVPDNGRLLIFGNSYGTYPEVATLGNTGKRINVEVVEGSGVAILGE